MKNNSQKILVVDDLQANIVAMKVILDPIDVEVICVTSGNDGLAATLDHEFALVLLDINMPGMDGFEMASLLRQNPATTRVPIIFVTAAYDDDMTRIRGYDSGAVDYIVKPINSQILLSKIKVFLELDEAKSQMVELLATLEARVEEQTLSLREEMAERAKAEEKTKESEKMFRTILSTAIDAIVVCGADKKIILWNPGAEHIIGYNENEMVGKPITSILSENSESEQYTDFFLSPTDEKFPDPKPFTIDAVTKTGNTIPIEMSLSRWEKNDEWTFVLVFRDIRDRMRRQHDLEDAVKDALYANHTKTLFLANMSHELRTPLNSIIAFSEIMSMEMMGELSDVYSEYADNIHMSGTFLLRIIQDVLDMSKVEAGTMDIFEDVMGLIDIMDDVKTLIAPQLKENSTELLINIHPEHSFVFCDQVRIKQCLLNLIVNAIKFSPKGHVKINTEIDSKWITIHINDDGVGMSDDEIKVALKLYGQIETDAHVRKTGGAGLGITLTQQLLKLHGGHLILSSEKGVGTTASIFLPIDRLRTNPDNA